MDKQTQLEQDIKNLPQSPGVYLMKNDDRDIIYIGKASSLKKRVSSYFQKTSTDYKTTLLRNNIASVEFIVTDTEVEALILESTLIKKHLPKYNVRLKDDKRYPYIAVTLTEDYPKIIFTRDTRRKKNKYFGPYTDANAARRIVSLINTIFKLKTCKKDIPIKKGERPCLNYQMNRCTGVCIGAMSKEDYHGLVENAINFLEGNIAPVMENLEKMMNRYSENFEYEKAAQIRDIIFDIQKLSEDQKVYVPIQADQDYIAHGIFDSEAIVVLFEFRKGLLLGNKISIFDNALYSEPEEILRSFILNFYDKAELPQRIIVEARIKDKSTIEDFLTQKSSKRIILSPPKTKDDKSIINLIKKNIDTIASHRAGHRDLEKVDKGLKDLQTILGLKTQPKTIECYDISNLQGTDSVASMVFFRDGFPDKSQYRRYKIRGYESSNDPAMIHEVISRRLQHLVNEEEELPDLFVIDGGPTQLTRAMEAAENFDVQVNIISIAKRNEEIYINPNDIPIVLQKTSPSLHIIQNARDEAHRFAVSYHRKLRDKKLKKSELDDIPNIGQKTKLLLLNTFGSVAKVKEAEMTELKAVDGIGPKTAEKIFSFFHG